MRYIIIGVSAAGVAAAREIRKKDLTCDITMLCMEDAVHSRCMLHHMVGGLKTREQLNFVEKDFFRDNRIDFRPESVVSKIDCEAKQSELVTGGRTERKSVVEGKRGKRSVEGGGGGGRKKKKRGGGRGGGE